MANHIEMDFIVKGYQEAHQQMRNMLDMKKDASGKTIMELSLKGSEKALNDYAKLRQYIQELKEEQKTFTQGSKEWDVVAQRINDVTNATTRLKNAINNYGTEFDKVTLKNIENIQKLEKTQERAAKAKANQHSLDDVRKQVEEQVKIIQDANRKLERNKAQNLKEKGQTPSEVAYLEKSMKLAEKELNNLLKKADSFKGKFSGAADEIKKIKQHAQDALDFNKDNTKEGIARDEIKNLEKDWERLEKKRQEYVNKYGEESQFVKDVANKQKEVTAELEKQRQVLNDALETERAKKTTDKESLDAQRQKNIAAQQEFEAMQKTSQAAFEADQQYKSLKEEVKERLALEEKLAKLQQNPSKHKAEIAALKQILSTKRSQKDIEEAINKLPPKYRDELNKIIATQKEQNKLDQAHNSDLQKNNKTLGESLKNFMKFTAYYFVLQKMKQLVNEMLETMKELDKAFTDIQMVTGGTDEETAQLADSYNQLAKEVGSTTTEVAEGAAEWLRQR